MPKAKIKKDIPHNEFLEQILAVVPGHVYWKNLNSEFLGCNDLQAIDAGFKSRKEIVGLTDFDMPWRENADLLRKIDTEVIKTGKEIVTEESSKTYSGKDAIWLSTKKPLRNEKGKIIGIIGISLDITAQKEAEELRLELEKHKAIEQKNKLFKDFTEQLTGLINKFQVLSDRGESELNIDNGDTLKLTKRETEVLYFLSRGNKPKDIAIKLGISHKTAQNIIDGKLFPKFKTNKINSLLEKARILNLIPLTLEI
ncbi:MAG TPA: PAS domain-containing protein [Aquella sp.]|nr:PAS domain-containing protein [Aquella sp.]